MTYLATYDSIFMIDEEQEAQQRELEDDGEPEVSGSLDLDVDDLYAMPITDEEDSNDGDW